MVCKTCNSVFKSTSPLSRCPHCGRYNGFIRNDEGFAVEIKQPGIGTAKQVVRSKKDANIQTDEDQVQERTVE